MSVNKPAPCLESVPPLVPSLKTASTVPVAARIDIEGVSAGCSKFQNKTTVNRQIIVGIVVPDRSVVPTKISNPTPRVRFSTCSVPALLILQVPVPLPEFASVRKRVFSKPPVTLLPPIFSVPLPLLPTMSP